MTNAERIHPEHAAPSNEEIAASFDQLADLLEAQGANMFRVRAYRASAQNIRNLNRSVCDIVETEGVDGLLALPGIGYSLSPSLEKLCHTGRLPLLQRLQGEAGPERLFMTLPGVGLEFACRIHEQLGVENLNDLELAAYDGRLARVSGMGPKRVRSIQECLRGRFRRPAIAPPLPHGEDPSVEELLDVDREYREKAAAGQLRKIAPRRMNPTGDAWLPVLHANRGERHYSALYSNTARAHELGMTHDWVVIYRDDQSGEGQWTAITSRFGPMAGKRIIRGREGECATLYERRNMAASTTSADS